MKEHCPLKSSQCFSRLQLVTAILSVSAAPPFQELEQLDAMPGQQAIFIQAARQAPWMARLMTRLLTIRTRRLVADLQVPTVLLHGCRNPTTPPAYLEIFRKLNRRLRIELVEDAGLTLAVSHPQRVYEELSRLSASDD